jgi:hypothetical protein
MALESMNTIKSNGRQINTTYAFLKIQLSQHYNSSKTELLVSNNEFISPQYDYGLSMVVAEVPDHSRTTISFLELTL